MKIRFYMTMAGATLLAAACVLALALLPAGRWDYWQGWTLSIACAAFSLGKFLLFAHKKDLICERMHPGPGTKWWDKLFYALYMPAFLGVVVVGGLDAGRFVWSPAMHWSVYLAGWTAFLAGGALATWSAWVNSFFSSVVRIQSERGHRVVREGPYRYVRHPGYVGGILLAPGTALVLGSLWALIPAGATIILLVARTYLEDAMLQRELHGYGEYAAETRYRLLPGLW